MSNQAQGTRHKALIDNYGREIEYLRISVTDRCNFRCGYCYADSKFLPREQILTLEEIAKVAEIAVGLGFKAIKLTGGEPLVRKNICRLIKDISKLPIKDLSLTTNGYNLAGIAADLKESGLKRITVSLDSLNEDNFNELSKTKEFNKVMTGIDEALKVFGELKINTVLIKEVNEREITGFLEFARNKPVHLRFIELVSSNGYKPVSTASVKNIIGNKYVLGEEINNGMGPAQVYKAKGFLGSIGFVSLKEQQFCDKCNRMRIKANGSIKPCLYNKEEISFLEPLREDDYEEVERLILKAIKEKPLKSKELVTQMRVNGG